MYAAYKVDGSKKVPFTPFGVGPKGSALRKEGIIVDASGAAPAIEKPAHVKGAPGKP